jgi:hypothetical protein
MQIKEIISESIIDEYRTTRSYDPMGHVRTGDREKNEMPVVKTPLANFEVRYTQDGDYHDYYMYDKTGKCVGLFTIEDTRDVPLKVTKPGIRAVTPHMALSPVAQRQGISTLAYTSFLRGGPWVFVTDEHTEAASKLWDSIATGDITSFYVSEINGKPVQTPGYHDVRVMGPKDRFKITR